MSVLPIVTMSDANIQKVRDWAQTYGAVVRQGTNRQQTTMAKHRALPYYMYQRILTPASQTAAKIVDTDHKDNSDKRDLNGDKNGNARISEMKMRISLFPL